MPSPGGGGGGGERGGCALLPAVPSRTEPSSPAPPAPSCCRGECRGRRGGGRRRARAPPARRRSPCAPSRFPPPLGGAGRCGARAGRRACPTPATWTAPTTSSRVSAARRGRCSSRSGPRRGGGPGNPDPAPGTPARPLPDPAEPRLPARPASPHALARGGERGGAVATLALEQGDSPGAGGENAPGGGRGG